MRRRRFPKRSTAGKAGVKPLIRDPRAMNKQEANYAEHLKQKVQSGQIVDYKYEPFGIRLANHRCHYHPDFMVVYPDRFAVHEVKAYSKKTKKPRWEDDAIVKFKVASSLYSYWEFKIVFFNTDTKEWDSIEF